MLDRIVDVLADVGEGDDRLAPGGDLVGSQAQQGRGKVDVGKSRIVRMEARAQFQQRADATADVDPAAGRGDDAGDDLEQGRLAGAVLADDAQRLAGGEIEGHLV